MNTTEFNKKYADYIEERFEDQGLMINHEKAIEFLDEIFGQVLIHIPGFKYSQIKMKFNSSRVYVDNVPASLMFWMEDSINHIIKSNVKN